MAPMDIAVTGSTGFIGRALVASLEADGHRVVPVVRRAGTPGAVLWDPAEGTIVAEGLEGLDAVVHLAGEGIATGPWTEAQRRRIHDSRRQGTTVLATALAGLSRPPAVLVSSSGINYYGDRGDDVVDEAEPAGSGFLARVCVDWEQATTPAADAGIRTVQLRTGLVLDAGGGVLAKLLLAVKLGVGGPAGSGRQWVSWISLADQVAAIRHAIDTPALSGPANAVGPKPVTNLALMKTLGRILHRPTFLRIPAAVRHVPFGVGDLVGTLLFESVRAEPAALTASGFAFTHTQLEPTLRDLLGRPD